MKLKHIPHDYLDRDDDENDVYMNKQKKVSKRKYKYNYEE